MAYDLTFEEDTNELTFDAETIDPNIVTSVLSFTLCDESGNDIVDESGNFIGGDTNFNSRTVVLTFEADDNELHF